MKNYTKKTNGGAEIYPVVIRSTSDFERMLKGPAGIYVLNANSLVDTERVDLYDKGKVGHQAVDLHNMTGDPQYIGMLEQMLAKKDSSFFAGSLLRDFGNFYMLTMPIIEKGKLIAERVVQSNYAFVDDRVALARDLIGEDLANRLESYRGPEFEGPAEEFNKIMKEKVGKIAKNSLKSIKIGGYNILPIICNEIFVIPDLYAGEKIDLIAHSCNDLVHDEDEIIPIYEKFIEKMQKKGLVAPRLTFATSQLGSQRQGYPSLAGVRIYENGSLKRME